MVHWIQNFKNCNGIESSGTTIREVDLLRDHQVISSHLEEEFMSAKSVRITHRPTGTRLAEGPLGWGITRFEGNFYIRKKYLLTQGFKPNYIPGLCPYKFLYVWMDLNLKDGSKLKNLGWLYWLPNPLLPFIWYRIGLPGSNPDILVEEFE